MRTTLIAFVLAGAVLTGCSKSSSPGTPSGKASNDAVSQKLQQDAGSGATDCGRVKTQDQAQIKPASDCAMQATKDKHAFYVAYEMPGLIVGYAGNAQGQLYSVQSEPTPNAPAGSSPEVKSEPCPGELRLAQSGRVTCLTPGSMGFGGANPHGGMMPATGENPHGNMSMPPAGTPNPHGGMGQPSHPPASKAPPKG